MSAECSTCGADLTYTPGSWPLGSCERCDLHEQLEKTNEALGEAAEALERATTHLLLPPSKESREVWELAVRLLANPVTAAALENRRKAGI